MPAARKSFVGTMSRGKADRSGPPKTQSLSFSTFKCGIHLPLGPEEPHKLVVSFHLLQDK